MRITCVLLGLSLLVAYAHASPVVKREAESDDLSPLNEVYILEADDDQAADGERSDRDKRKIGVLKLGVSNGIINFVFGKLDSFLDAKTKALTTLDEANKVKNAAFGIDAHHSATSKFINDLVAAKIQAASGSIGPVVNSAQTLLASAKTGLTGAFISKLAPLSSIVSGLSSGSAAKHSPPLHSPPVHSPPAHSGAGEIENTATQILGRLVSSKLSSLAALGEKDGHSAGSPSEGSALGTFANGGGYEYDPPLAAYYTA